MTEDQEILSRNIISHHYIRRILCPVDLSGESEQALAYAVALARAYNARLFICHCTATPLPDGGMRVRERFREMLAPFLDVSGAPALDWQGLVSEGSPGAVVSREASENQIDLIVMSSRRRPFTAALLGSNAEAISSTAPCPVLVMHQHTRAWIDSQARKISLKRILVAYDYSTNAGLALSCALSFAAEYQAALHLVNVQPIVSERAWQPMSAEQLQQQVKMLRRVLPEDVKLPGEVQAAVAEGQPYNEILAYAEENNIDLICIGSHHSGKAPALGSTVDRVLREASCPVLVARPLSWTAPGEKRLARRVLIAVDGSSFSDQIVREAATRTWPAGSELRVVTVMEPLATLGPTTTHYRLPSEVLDALEKVARQAAETLKSTGLTVTCTVRGGMAADEIIAEAKDWQADLIMVGTHGRRGVSRFLLGSVAERVAAYANCSVEIVRRAAQQARSA